MLHNGLNIAPCAPSAFPGFFAILTALTPRRVSNPDGVSLLYTIGLSRHSAPKHPMDDGIPLHSVAGSGISRSLRLRLRHSYAGSPIHQAETGSSSCGLSVCFLLLSTPHYCDAVTFNYRLSNFSRTGLPPASPMCSKAHAGPMPSSGFTPKCF